MTDAIARNGHESIAAGSKSFALASRLFDAELRNPVTELYAWCRYCDDAVDGQEFGHEQKLPSVQAQQRILAQLQARTERALAGMPDEDPVFQGLARVVRNHEIAPQYPRELLQGFAMDVRHRVYENEAELLEYCYHVAGVVGVMMAQIMGVKDACVLDRACDLGLAFQLTNIARDLVDDARAGRVYVPLRLLRDHGVVGGGHASSAQNAAAVEALTQEENWPKAHGAVMQLLHLAERYYQSATAGLPYLPFRCRWAVNAALKVYRDIGVQLQRQGARAWHRRVSTSHPRKLWLTAMALPFATAGQEVPRALELYCRPGRYSNG